MEREEQVRPHGEVLDALRVGLGHPLEPWARVRPFVEAHGERLADEWLPATLPPATRRNIFAKVVRGERIQLRMHTRAVVALRVVLDEDLPVRRHVVRLALGESQWREVKTCKHVNKIVEVREKRLSLFVEGEEDEALPRLAAQRHQVVVAGIESLQIFGVLRLLQLAVGAVDPGVIRADDLLRLAAVGLAVGGPFNKRCAAVAAGVDKGVQLVVFAARDDHLLTSELQQSIGADVWRLLFASDATPLVAEDLLRLPVEDRLVVEDLWGEHVGLVKGATHGGDGGRVEWGGALRNNHAAMVPRRGAI